MVSVIIISAATCFLMIIGVLFFPKIRIGRRHFGSYWIVTVLGAAIILAARLVSPVTVWRALVADTAVNPLKILTLFISMTVLSIFLDEAGFFRYLASAALRHAKTGQTKLFFYLYFTVSVLTVFTSNDVIILSFTPFVCYFAKHAGIRPAPYLAAEFVAANTWSMALIIGNPTNIYLASASGAEFFSYLEISIIPTLFAGAAALLALWLMFRKSLSSPLTAEPETVVIEDKFLLVTGIVHLVACIILLAAGSYIGIEMWAASLGVTGSLFVITLAYSAIKRKKPVAIKRCFSRAPYQLVPFVLSMFVLIVGLTEKGVTGKIGELLSLGDPVWTYGISSFFAANLINNIPMSVLYSSVISGAGAGQAAVFATVIGSNLGAFFTPVGALAGIMWTEILSTHGVRFGYKDFLKIGSGVGIGALIAALCGLKLSLLLFA